MKSKLEELRSFCSPNFPGTVKHAFFTRQGGKSLGDCFSLNFVVRGSEKRESVEENKKIVTNFFAVKPRELKILNQIHSANVIEITNINQEVEAIEADALVTRLSGVVLGVVTADCVPILLCDPQAKIIATIHAGWRGAVKGVIQNTVQTMKELGGNVDSIYAVIGPAIQQNSYEVDQEFYNNFMAQSSVNAQYFMSGEATGKYMFNLPAYCHQQLSSLGISKLDNLELNTYTNPDLFFSCRRSTHEGNKFGCQLSAIMLEG
jgi:polyphenol oxidase